MYLSEAIHRAALDRGLKSKAVDIAYGKVQDFSRPWGFLLLVSTLARCAVILHLSTSRSSVLEHDKSTLPRSPSMAMESQDLAGLCKAAGVWWTMCPGTGLSLARMFGACYCRRLWGCLMFI